ncbi:enhancer of mRNA-decapping protein 4 homolog, partial [Ctenocephalides felis]|uniref:enhancer of mRNA-decapping protein 4 homolog n=1 Tax=Ctenocephalides felis TaxID=7515 RepID=UPI000E6E4E18
MAETQTINFDGTEENHFYEITSDDVEIISSSGKHELGCSKVTLKNTVDFNWEHKLYLGHVVAVHMLGKHIAYGIKAKSGGMVRVIRDNCPIRGIIKGYAGQPQDLAFAHIEEEIILASVDEEGNLFVHSIETPDVSCVLKLHIPYKSPSPMTHRVIWCPYIPEPDSAGEVDEDTAKLLVVTHGCDAVVISVNTVIETYGPDPLAKGHDIIEGILELLDEHTKPITDAMFAPDGTLIATTSGSGEVKFFQVYMHVEKTTNTRCLHQWKPHDGKPVSSIFFLDNHQNHNPTVEYWKFAITGCNNNSELKLWSCQSWSCLQTIIIKPNPNMKHLNGNLTLKACLDKSAQYLILSDIYNRIMYIMQIIKTEDESQAFIKSVSEFLLPCSVLSFDVVETGLLKYKYMNNTDDMYELDDEGMDDDLISASPVNNSTLGQFQSYKGVFVRLYVVQPKSLQECRIIYHPQINYSTTINMMNTDNYAFTDNLADISSISVNNHDDQNNKTNDDISKTLLKDLVNITNDFNDLSVQQSTPLQNVQSQTVPSHINLMTPDAFNNLKKEVPAQNINVDSADENKINNENSLKAFDGSVLEARVSSSPKMNQKLFDDLMYLGAKRLEEVEAPLATSESFEKKATRDNLASGGSSPSREVQEILSLKDSRSDLLDFDLIDNGDIQETSNEAIIQTLKTVVPVPVPTSNTDISKEDKGWPCPPVVEPMQVSESTCSGASNSIGSSNVFATYTSTKNQTLDDNQSISSSLDKVLSILSQQTKQIQNLQLEIQKIRDKESVLHNTCTENSNIGRNMEINLEKVVEQAMMKAHMQQASSLDSLITKMTSSMISDLHRTVSETLMQILNQQMIDKFSTNCTIEIQRSVVPTVVTSLDKLKQAMQHDMSKKLTATDHFKETVELLTNSLLMASQSVLNNTLRAQMDTFLIPSFERATNQMFKQIHETFSQGTKEYLNNFELALEKNRRQLDKSKDVIYRMDQLSESLKAHAETTNTINKYVHESVSKTMKIMQDNLIKNISDHINMAFSKQSEELE